MPASEFRHDMGIQLPELHKPGSLLTVYPGQALRGEVGGGGHSRPCRGINRSRTGRRYLQRWLTVRAGWSNFLVSGVTEAMLEALTALGVRWRLERTTLTVQGVGLEPRAGSTSGTPAMRQFCHHLAATGRRAGCLGQGGGAGRLAGLTQTTDGADHRAACG